MAGKEAEASMDFDTFKNFTSYPKDKLMWFILDKTFQLKFINYLKMIFLKTSNLKLKSEIIF